MMKLFFCYLLLIPFLAGVLLHNMWMISRIHSNVMANNNNNNVFALTTTNRRITSLSTGTSTTEKASFRATTRSQIGQQVQVAERQPSLHETAAPTTPITILEHYKRQHSIAVLQQELVAQQQISNASKDAAASKRTFLVAHLGDKCPISKPGFANALLLAILTNRTLLVQYPNTTTTTTTITHNNKLQHCPEQQRLQQADWLGVWDNYYDAGFRNPSSHNITWWQDLVTDETTATAADTNTDEHNMEEFQTSVAANTTTTTTTTTTKGTVTLPVIVGVNTANDLLASSSMASSLFYDNSPSLLDLRDETVRQYIFSVLPIQQQQQQQSQEEQEQQLHLLLQSLYQQGPQYLQGVLFWSSFSVPNRLSLVSSMRRKKQQRNMPVSWRSLANIL